MPSRPRSNKPGWRGGAEDRPRRGRPLGQKASSWTKQKEHQYEGAVRRHYLWLGACAVVLIALIGVLVWYLYYSPLSTPFLACAVTEYHWPIPPNAWASEDVDRFGTSSEDKNLRYISFKFEGKDKPLEDLRRRLLEDDTHPGGPDKDVIIIYLSMHGVVNDKNEPCLLLPWAEPSAPEEWLPVRDLLDELKNRKNAKRVKVLLILDANRMDANWRLGLLYNGFAERLEDLVDKNKVDDPNLIVLNSASPGQIGWAAPELGGSVFGYYLWRGLKGEADGHGDKGDKNDQVSLKELVSYLTATVNGWAINRRGDRQQPMLLPAGAKDHPLVHAIWTEIDHPKPANVSWENVAELWKKHQQLHNEKTYRLNPLKWEEFQHGLLHLEQLTQAGPSYEVKRSEVESSLRGLVTQLEQGAADPQLAARSLPLAHLFRPPDNGQMKPAAKQLEARLNPKEVEAKIEGGAEKPAPEAGDAPAAKQPAKAADGENGPQEPAKQPKEDAAPENAAGGSQPTGQPQDHPPYGYAAAAQAAWERALQDIEDRGKLDKAIQFVKEANSAGEPDFVETRFLRMIYKYLDKKVWQEDGLVSVLEALQSRGQAEEAAAPKDERTHYWVRAAVEQADAKRRIAEDKLFVGDEKSLGEAMDLWKAAGGENLEEGQGQQAKTYSAADKADDLAEALKTRDEAWAKTPYLAEWLLGRLRKRGSDEQERGLRDQLQGLIEKNHELAKAIDAPLENEESPSDLMKKRLAVENHLKALEEAYYRECHELLYRTADHAVRCRRIASVLAVPLVTGKDRRTLLDDFPGDAADGDTPGAAGSGKRGGGNNGADAADQPRGGPSEYLRRLAYWREHPALTILKLARFEDVSDLPPPGEPGGKSDSGAASEEAQAGQALPRLAEEGEDLRQRIYRGQKELPPKGNDQPPKAVYTKAEELIEETRAKLKEGGHSPSEVRRSCSKADRLVRASAALLDHKGHELWTEDPTKDPVHQLRYLDLHYLMLWHAERVLEDFWGPKPEGEIPFFEMAAERYVGSAKGLVERVCRKSTSLRIARGSLENRVKAAEKPLELNEQQMLLAGEGDEKIRHTVVVRKMAPGLPKGEAAYYLEARESEQAVELLHENTNAHRLSVRIPEDDGEEPGEYWILNKGGLANVLSKAQPQKEGDPAVTARAYYRGHVAPCPCSPARETLRVEFEPLKKPSRIHVSALKRGYPTVVFLFDCSGSMRDRMGEATSALTQIIKSLDDLRKPPQVGLVAFGNRCYGGKNNQVAVRGPVKVPPAADVEWLVTPQKLPKVRSQILGHLGGGDASSLKAGGWTPLYLAIIKAVEENGVPEGKRREKERHVIVITDGVNNLKTLPDADITIAGVPSKAIKTYEDLEQVLNDPRNRDIRLDIVGYTFTKADRDAISLLRQFMCLPATKARRSLGFAENTDDLVKMLKHFLGLWEFDVREGREPNETTVKIDAIDKTVEIPYSGRKKSYSVCVERPPVCAEGPRTIRKRVDLEGGEAVRLLLSEDANDLVFKSYDLTKNIWTKPLSAEKKHAAEDGKWFYVQAGFPDATAEGGVRFDVLIYIDDEEEFSPRPKEIWIEIQPKLADGETNAGPVRTFYDLNYMVHQPVPRFICQDKNWPKEAKIAEIGIWFKLAETPGKPSRTVRDLEQQPFQVEGVKFKAKIWRPEQSSDPCLVEISEVHLSGGETPPKFIKVEMDPLEISEVHLSGGETPPKFIKVEMDPLPDKVVRRFFPAGSTVFHTFFYPAAKEPDVRNYRVRFTTKEKFTEDAFSLPEPLRVRVSGEDLTNP